MSGQKIMVTYSNSTKLLSINENESLGVFKGKLAETFNIPKNSILVHYGQKIFSNSEDSKIISDLGIRRAIKLSINHTLAYMQKK